MQKLILYSIILSTTLFSSEITVEVSNIKNLKGDLFIGLFDKKESFPKKDKVFKGVVLKVDSKTIKYIFKDVPDGTYAISSFCDENSNKKFDKNFFGIPKEGYGFSNGATSPSFNSAKFELKESVEIKIEVGY